MFSLVETQNYMTANKLNLHNECISTLKKAKKIL